MNLPDKLRDKLANIPDEPGCYIMRDRRGKIIYVGKAASLRKRVQSYFRDASLLRGDPKLRGLVKSVQDIEFMVLRNEAAAILTEGQLIKDYKPYYNVKLRDDKRFLLIRADPSAPSPALTLCRIKRDNDGCIYFGPYASSSAARATADFTEKKFGLRKCAAFNPDSQAYKHCINDIVRYCSAPCIGRISREEYHQRFDEACAFLGGERPEYLKELRADMEAASGKKEFERAAALRDTLFLIQAAVKQKARIAQTPDMKAQDGKGAVVELQRTLELERAPRLIEGYDISNISGTYAVGSMVCSMNGLPLRNKYRRFRIKTVEGSNDVAMMTEVIHRRFSRLLAEGGQAPDLVLIDGGAAQVGAVREELKRLGLENIPVAGLAKRLEEIYWREDVPPLRLPGESSALKMLQRLRDEAHRFALTYHLRLRARRISESALDEVEGIGEKKKQLLLHHFGSVRSMREAEVDQIAKLPGIGYKLASAIKEALGKGNKPSK
jgi:excinuclease ABC subunit C